MAISPDGTTLLVGDAEGPVRVQRVADDQVLHTIPGQSPVTVVAWSPKGRRFAIGRLDGTSEVYSLDPLQRVMINSGSDRVSVLGFVGEHGLMRESITGSIARYDLAALSPVATQVATAPIHALDAAAGLIAQGEDNGRVTIRDGRTLRQIGEKLTLGPYRSRDRGPEMASARQVTALALTPDGSAVIAADRVGHLRMWSLPGRELLWSRDDVPTSWLAVSPDGRYLATVGNTFKGGVPDGAPVTSTVTVWNLSTHAVHLSEDLTAQCQYREPGIDHTEPITPRLRAVAFSPDGSKVASRQQRLPRLRDDLRPGAAATDVAADDVQDPPVLGGLLTRQPATPGRQPGLLSGNGMQPRGRCCSRSLDTGPARPHQNDLHRGRPVAGHLPPPLPERARRPDAASRRRRPAPAHRGSHRRVRQSPQGQDHQLLVGTRSVLASIEMDPEQWKSAACQVAARNSPRLNSPRMQWNRFLPGIPYSPACR